MLEETGLVTKELSGKANIFLIAPPTATVELRSKVQMELLHNVIEKIARRYSLPLIDVMYKSGISDFTRSYYQPVDGLHCGKLGYQKLADYIGNEIYHTI